MTDTSSARSGRGRGREDGREPPVARVPRRLAGEQRDRRLGGRRRLGARAIASAASSSARTAGCLATRASSPRRAATRAARGPPCAHASSIAPSSRSPRAHATAAPTASSSCLDHLEHPLRDDARRGRAPSERHPRRVLERGPVALRERQRHVRRQPRVARAVRPRHDELSRLPGTQVVVERERHHAVEQLAAAPRRARAAAASRRSARRPPTGRGGPPARAGVRRARGR